MTISRVTPHYADDLVTLHHGDCLEVLAPMEESSVASIVTDPPYELGFMGRPWDASGVAYDVSVWRAALRVLKPGGYLLAFGGTRTYHRLACAIEDAGFEIRDSLHWVHGEGFPKGKACLKPAHEPIVLARKPDKRSGPLPGLDACRVSHGDDLSRYERSGTSGFKQGGIYGVGEPAMTPAHGAGRWPPNILLTHDPECVGFWCQVRDETHSGGRNFKIAEAWDCTPGCPVVGLDAQSGITKDGSHGGGRGGFDYSGNGATYGGRGKEGFDASGGYGGSGGASRFFPVLNWSPDYDRPFLYCAKAPKSERPRLPDGTAWPTVKPLALMRWLVRLVTPPGGTVLDLFAGTGTTGQAAALEGFPSLLIERDPVAVELALQRLSKPVSPALFG